MIRRTQRQRPVARVGSARLALARTVVALLLLAPAERTRAQEAVHGELRQLVTFRFLPGESEAAWSVFRDHALPLYRQNEAMRSVRAFREVESPVPMDLVVVSSFRGMAGMDASNQALRRLASETGTSMEDVHGRIAALSADHHDQFVTMLPAFSHGDPSARPLVALVWYRLMPGEARRFERALEEELVPWERASSIPAATGRFLVSDGWDYLRWIGFDSLADYQAYWEAVGSVGHGYIDGITAKRREVIVAPVPELAVR